MAGSLDFRIQQLLNSFPDAITPGPDHHASAHTGFFSKIGLADDGLIPGSEILFARDGECMSHCSDLRRGNKNPKEPGVAIEYGQGKRREGRAIGGKGSARADTERKSAV